MTSHVHIPLGCHRSSQAFCRRMPSVPAACWTAKQSQAAHKGGSLGALLAARLASAISHRPPHNSLASPLGQLILDCGLSHQPHMAPERPESESCALGAEGEIAMLNSRIGQRWWIFSRSNPGWSRRHRIADLLASGTACSAFDVPMGMLMLANVAIDDVRDADAARRNGLLPSAPSSSVRDRRAGVRQRDATSSALRVTYQYTVSSDGSAMNTPAHVGAAAALWRRDPDGEARRHFFERYVPVQRAVVYYNPENTAQAVPRTKAVADARNRHSALGLALVALGFWCVVIHRPGCAEASQRSAAPS